MKIMHTMASEANASRPQRRFYSPELKGQVRQECRQSGASVAGVALSHGINADIVHRWLREPTQCGLVPVPQVSGSVAVTLNDPVPTLASQPPDIRLEVRRGASSVIVSWLLQGAGSFTPWLREWLR